MNKSLKIGIYGTVTKCFSFTDEYYSFDVIEQYMCCNFVLLFLNVDNGLLKYRRRVEPLLLHRFLLQLFGTTTQRIYKFEGLQRWSFCCVISMISVTFGGSDKEKGRT